jgi:hypothetical protein
LRRPNAVLTAAASHAAAGLPVKQVEKKVKAEKAVSGFPDEPTSRALVNELLLENDDEMEKEIEEGNGAAAEEEDADEFGEDEEMRILLPDDAFHDDGDDCREDDDADARTQEGWNFEDDDDGEDAALDSSLNSDGGAGSGPDDTDEVDRSAVDISDASYLEGASDLMDPDPFRSAIVPAMFTADLLLLDPVRHAQDIAAAAAGAAGGLVAGEGAEAGVVTPSRGRKGPLEASAATELVTGPPDTQTPFWQVSGAGCASTDALATPSGGKGGGGMDSRKNREKQLKVAELQEYLVSKLGSAKVSMALQLLVENAAVTMTPSSVDSTGTGASSTNSKTDSFYEERDEELLNRIEDILGTDCLHYLDDMFLLLTLQ